MKIWKMVERGRERGREMPKQGKEKKESGKQEEPNTSGLPAKTEEKI